MFRAILESLHNSVRHVDFLTARGDEVKVCLVETKALRDLQVINTLQSFSCITRNGSILADLTQMAQLLLGQVSVALEAGLVELIDTDGSLL